jgi:predicted nucleic acid-binding protein
MAAFVLDASVTMAWCFQDEATEGTRLLLERMAEESAAIPPLWFLEVTNVLVQAQRAGRISDAQVAAFVRLLKMLEWEVDQQPPERVFDHLMPLCRRHRISSYDAAYLDLAMRAGIPLATLDSGLREAAAAAGVEVLG